MAPSKKQESSASIPSPPEQVAQDSDEREADAGGDEQVEFEQVAPMSTTGQMYDGSVVVEETARPWLTQ
jgi:hypothetical protein